jgi:hypothetical protein
MTRPAFPFLIAWIMSSSAVIPVTATKPTPRPVPPVPAQVLEFLADHLEIDMKAPTLAIIGFSLRELGRVKCPVG